MAEVTGISWCHHTKNLWWGCTKVSPACDRCYAETDAKRYGFQIWGQDAERRPIGKIESRFNDLRKWNRHAAEAGEIRTVFWNSMSDIMEDRRDLDALRESAYPEMEAATNLMHLLLTKRPQNFRRLLPFSWLNGPPKNVCLMTTVESPEYYWRIAELAKTNAHRRGLSIEPMLADMPDLGKHLSCIDWVIVGGESGHGARPMPIEWARSVKDQCQTAEVRYFLKQLGGARDKRKELANFPLDLQIQEPLVATR